MIFEDTVLVSDLLRTPRSAFRMQLRVEVINTGTELLLGNILNTHLAYFAQRLFAMGLRVARQATVPDGALIRNAVLEAMGRCDVLLITGGLGPTSDDVTREIVAELLGLPLQENAEVIAAIEARCLLRKFPFLPSMRRQALVPLGATALCNENGTAPGIYLAPIMRPSWATPHLFLLPGPPRELKPMFEAFVEPILYDLINDGCSRDEMRTYQIIGMGESIVEEVIGKALEADSRLEVGYCARPNEVSLRLIGPKNALDSVEPRVRAVLGKYLAFIGEGTLEQAVVGLLIAKSKTLATAESCTGGLLANRITNIPGASQVYLEGFVTYSNEAKASLLGVDPNLINREGAVSEAVAREMALGALKRGGSDFALATTGVAGPGGGTEEKPVGTVYISLAERGGGVSISREFFPTDRETFKQLVSQVALNKLRQALAFPRET